MRYLLRRDFSVLGYLFKRDASGTEIPEEINGKKIVLFSDFNPETTDIPLPNDAVLFEQAKDIDPNPIIIKNAPDKPIALSQMPIQKSPEELLKDKAAK